MGLDFVARARNAPKNIAIMKREGFAAFADVALELCEKLFYNDNNHKITLGRKLKKRLKTKASGLCVKHARALFFFWMPMSRPDWHAICNINRTSHNGQNSANKKVVVG